MNKAEQALIHIDMIDGDGTVEMRGKMSVVMNTLCCALMECATESNDVRKMIRKACRIVLRETRSRRAWEWIHSAKVGIFVIPGVLGVMWVIGEIGHALGVM